MRCSEFQKQVQAFLNNEEIPDETLKEFVEHAHSCDDCYDELEIYYILKTGLDDEEAMEHGALDFTTGLMNQLDAAMKGLDIKKRIASFRMTVFVCAEVITALTFLFCLWRAL
jgi:hypothetical protein